MRRIRSIAISLAHLCVLVSIVLLLAQHKMIYHPRHYPAAEVGEFKQLQTLSYSTSEGAQQCYFVPARSGAAVAQSSSPVWVVFPGNASLALDWMDFVSAFPSERDSFLLIDYPGYGACAGSPSSKSIRESSDAALGALATHLGISVAELEPRLRVIGHSLGAATALSFATLHPVSRIVLIAPFTSLRDMARRTVGWPLCYLLRDNFDNRARLREIAHRSPAPVVEILSGDADGVIPFKMGEELARGVPRVHFKTVAGVGHNTILSDGESQIFTAMTTADLVP